ncbi:MAG: signal peptidase II [Thermodesulfobacteria bacterium]|nr:signal peptidase II [Thermodesulfobacteriota bacterium]
MKKLFFSVFFVFFLDRVSKWIISKTLSYGAVIKILPFFNLVRGENRGIAFGLFQGIAGKLIFNGLIFIILLVIGKEALKISKRPQCTFETIGFGFILGGGVSNLFDRVVYGKVTDFLDFHLGAYHWPAFNVADAGVTIGFLMLIISYLRGKKCF